jgi:hypothetical protein
MDGATSRRDLLGTPLTIDAAIKLEPVKSVVKMAKLCQKRPIWNYFETKIFHGQFILKILIYGGLAPDYTNI